MFGNGKSYFAGSPVVIDIGGLQWPDSSPFNIVRVNVIYDGVKVDEVHADTGGQSSVSFDISSALRAIWSDYEYSGETSAANAAVGASSAQQHSRPMREYSLNVSTEYVASDDGGVFTKTDCGTFAGGRCMIGGLTEWERSLIADKADADASHLENTNLRNGDASTKPSGTPERVGKDSITSWTDVSASGTTSVFYPPTAENGRGASDTAAAHAPLVLRDSIAYVDFLFLNRRGAVETCSALTMESMGIDVEAKTYSRTGRPAFSPGRSLMTIGADGRRSWQMSSGYVTREWAEWWTMDFLGGKRKRWWMRYKGPGMQSAAYVPVTVEQAKKSVSIYDKTKQQMPHVDFTVTLALEG